MIYDTNGDLALKVCAVNEGGKVTVTLDGVYNDLKICLRNISMVKDLSGAACEIKDTGAVLTVTNNPVTFTVDGQ